MKRQSKIVCACGIAFALASWSQAADAQTRPSIAELQAEIAELQAARATDTIPGVAAFASMDTSSDPSRPTLIIHDANLQVVNGTGSTTATNGVGNLLIGYGALRTSGPSCSRSWGLGQTECSIAGGTWALNHRNGSHNLIVGDQQNYSGVASILAGFQNAVPEEGDSVVVLGGPGNTATGHYATVTGGANNVAIGVSSSVSGGTGRFAPESNDWAAGGLFQPN